MVWNRLTSGKVEEPITGEITGMISSEYGFEACVPHDLKQGFVLTTTSWIGIYWKCFTCMLLLPRLCAVSELFSFLFLFQIYCLSFVTTFISFTFLLTCHVDSGRHKIIYKQMDETLSNVVVNWQIWKETRHNIACACRLHWPHAWFTVCFLVIIWWVYKSVLLCKSGVWQWNSVNHA